MDIALSLVHISKLYCKRFVLDDIDFNVKSGEFVSILGSSGSGKSTILKLIAGIELPTEGKIIKNGIDITTMKISKRRIGFIFQNYALFPNMTVYNNVAYAISSLRISKEEKHKQVMDMLEIVGLTNEVYKKPSALSGGQQQRVAIARTLIQMPDIILFDEPMSALDTNIKSVLRDLIVKIRSKYHTTMVYVTHDLEEAFSLSDRILLLNDCKIEQFDTPKELYCHPSSEFVKSFIIDGLEQKKHSIEVCINATK